MREGILSKSIYVPKSLAKIFKPKYTIPLTIGLVISIIAQSLNFNSDSTILLSETSAITAYITTVLLQK